MSPNRSRKKIWEIENTFHCSIIGTCLSLTELRQLYKKCKFNLSNTLNDYELHHLFVHIANEACYPTKKLHKFLDHKYHKNISELMSLTSHDDLGELWSYSKKTGDISGNFWALITNPYINDKLLDVIYADIHMLSHLSGATLRLNIEAFKNLKSNHSILLKSHKELQNVTQKQLNNAYTKINKLEGEIIKKNNLEEKYNRLKDNLNNSNIYQVESLQNRLIKLKHKLKIEIEMRQGIESECKQENVHYTSTSNNLKESQFECKRLMKQIHELKLHNNELNFSDQSSYSDTINNLCGCCVLYVGGRNNLCAHFRELVEQRNGQFIHHDGGREEGTDKLNSTLSKADVVLCPLNCISHKAMKTIKKHCENKTKQIAFLPRDSISAFTKALNKIQV